MNLIKNYLSTMFFILILYLFYSTNVYYSNFLTNNLKSFGFEYNTRDIFKIIIGLYSILLIPFYYFEKEKSKARITLKYIHKKFKDKTYKISKVEKNALLTWLLKGFFAPLLILWIIQNTADLLFKLDLGNQNFSLYHKNFYFYFNNYIFKATFYLILLIDTFFFTLGYLLESKYLKNKIKSIEPTMFGWVVAIICYPPFNLASGNILGGYSTNFPKFGDNIYHYILTCLLLIFFAIYSRASVALGLKASNLTNRGIVKKGPYKFIRHPAYISKNISRFIGTLPAYIFAFKNGNFKMLFLITLSFSGWMIIYFLRAYTEEKHLEKDPDYKKYQKEVKYKFIPGVW